VVNVATAELLPAVRTCGSVSGRDCDKFDAAGLTREPSTVVSAVSVGECGAHIECIVKKEIAFEERTWFVGEVVAARMVPGHRGSDALLCGRNHYVLPGGIVGSR